MTKKEKVHRKVTGCADCPSTNSETFICELALDIPEGAVYASWRKNEPPPPECPLRDRAVILYLEELTTDS
jgi:hypothetical protein